MSGTANRTRVWPGYTRVPKMQRTALALEALNEYVFRRFDTGGLHGAGMLRLQRADFKVGKYLVLKWVELSVNNAWELRMFIIFSCRCSEFLRRARCKYRSGDACPQAKVEMQACRCRN